MDGIVRNAIAAAAIILTVGGGVLKANTDITTLQNSVTTLQTQMASLTAAFTKFRCSVKPTYDCP